MYKQMKAIYAQQLYFLMGNCCVKNNKQQKSIEKKVELSMLSRITVGGGCFWCIEAVLQRLRGVQKVESGYTAGHIKNPTYEQVCSGKSGHAEVCQIYYNHQEIPLNVLLYVFLHLHDPTTLNRQGNDTGTQYRSIILFEKGNLEEKSLIKKTIEEVTVEGKYPGSPAPIVTEVRQMDEFYPAEEYHQNYYNENSNQGYCRAVIKPKLGKLKSYFQKYLDSKKQ